ncbi:hypothetical protein V5O48_011191 [Marasmius crinis-equi]|uniref:Transmembrane protein n=1 Tax=Marasmius crinis-equi TaxID=585013 RepID=A0ABR3F6R1_9AGAR
MASSLNTVIVDDQDSRISYSGQWFLGGADTDYSHTSYAPRSEGAQMTFKFSGTSIVAVGNIEAGSTCNATFSIDGTPSSFTSPLVNATQHQQTIWSSPELTEGEHTLVYTSSSCVPAPNSTNSSTDYKSSVWFDYLLYDTGKIPDAATIFIDDRDQRLRYSGDWMREGGDGDFRLTRQGGKKGNSVQLSFTGSSVTVMGRLDNTSTGVQTSFTIDGQKQATYGAGSQSSVLRNIPFFRNGSLAQGEHTLVINCLDDGPFWLDYILLRSSTPKESQKTGVPVGAVVGAVAGIACLIVGILVWFFYFKRRKAGTQNSTFTTMPKRGLTIRRATRGYNGDDVDPFSRDPVPDTLTPPRPRPPNEPSLASSHSAAGLLSAAYDTRSMSDASSRHPASIHTDAHSHSHYDDPDDSPENLPPEYATTAPSGTNIGYIPPVPALPSVYSGTTSAQYPPSRSNTYSTMHHRVNSGPSDGAESELSYPPTRSASQSTTNQKPKGYGTSRFSGISQTSGSRQSYKSSQRFVAMNATEEEGHLSVAELKRRHQEVAYPNPVVHTDSGMRLPKPGESAYPSTPTSNVFSPIHERHMSLFSAESSHWGEDHHVPESSVGHGLHTYSRSEAPDPPSRPPTSHNTQATAGPSSSLDDGQSVAELKRRQQMLILSPEGVTSQPVMHTDSGVRVSSRGLPEVPSRNVPSRSDSFSTTTRTVHATAGPPPSLPPPTDPDVLTDVPPMYSLN